MHILIAPWINLDKGVRNIILGVGGTAGKVLPEKTRRWTSILMCCRPLLSSVRHNRLLSTHIGAWSTHIILLMLRY